VTDTSGSLTENLIDLIESFGGPRPASKGLSELYQALAVAITNFSGGESPTLTAPVTINGVTGAVTNLILNAVVGQTFPILQAYDHLGAPIAAIGITGGVQVFGDRVQAASGSVFGPFIALDATTNPPSILSTPAKPGYVYSSGGRLYLANGPPSTQWVMGTTNVNDLWIDFTLTNWFLGRCTVSGAGVGPGTWVPSTLYVATGTAALSAGTVTISNTSITANSRIQVFVQTPGGTVGAPFVSAITAATGFTIKSTSSTDTSTIRYEIESY
jgi:hypothetical protein